MRSGMLPAKCMHQVQAATTVRGLDKTGAGHHSNLNFQPCMDISRWKIAKYTWTFDFVKKSYILIQKHFTKENIQKFWLVLQLILANLLIFQAAILNSWHQGANEARIR